MAKKRKFNLISGREAIVLLIAILMAAFFCINASFRTYPTLITIANNVYYISLMAIGVAFPLITGGVDLSIGTGLVCYALIGGHLIVTYDMPVVVGLIACVLAGALIGVVNGVLVAIMDLPPFLATLCTCMITRGLGSVLFASRMVTWPSAFSEKGWYIKAFKITTESGTIVPVGIAVVVVIMLLMSFVLKKTKIGRYTIAIGSNKEATRLSGVNVRFYHISAYVISGVFAGLAGIAYAAIFGVVQPGAGAGTEMDAIGGAIVGGVSATGGYGTIFGSFLGVIVICLMKVGLPFIGLQANWQLIVTGLVLIGAVLVDVAKKKK